MNHGDEKYIYEIYGKAMTNLLREHKEQISYPEKKMAPYQYEKKKKE